MFTNIGFSLNSLICLSPCHSHSICVTLLLEFASLDASKPLFHFFVELIPYFLMSCHCFALSRCFLNWHTTSHLHTNAFVFFIANPPFMTQTIKTSFLWVVIHTPLFDKSAMRSPFSCHICPLHRNRYAFCEQNDCFQTLEIRLKNYPLCEKHSRCYKITDFAAHSATQDHPNF